MELIVVQFRIIYEKKFFLLYHIFIGDHKERAHLSAGGGIRQRESLVYDMEAFLFYLGISPGAVTHWGSEQTPFIRHQTM